MSENIKNILKIDQSQASILRLVLDDPNNKNALSKDMMSQLKKLLIKASSDDSIKVIIIAAVGDVFCSGHNLKAVSYTHLTLPRSTLCRSRWSPYH